MRFDYLKETTPVIYGERSVKLLRFSFKASYSCCFRTHWHERIEIILVRNGSMNFTLDGEVSTAFAGDILVAAPCQSHGATTGKGGATYDVLMFDISNLKNNTIAFEKYLSPILSGALTYTSPIRDAKVQRIFDDITALLTESTARSVALTCIGKLYEMMGALDRHAVVRIPRPDDERIKQVTDYISEHYNEPLSTAALSELFGYNEAYFCRRFKKITGLSVMKYINTARLEAACDELKAGEDIKKCSLSCGFNDTGYFSRCFKAHFGMTPSEYRELNTNKK